LSAETIGQIHCQDISRKRRSREFENRLFDINGSLAESNSLCASAQIKDWNFFVSETQSFRAPSLLYGGFFLKASRHCNALRANCRGKSMRFNARRSQIGSVILWIVVAALSVACKEASAQSDAARRPNILLILTDDVGIDQLRTMGYGGLTAPPTPNIDSIANAGVRFRDAWAMPACSTSRGVL
jgi:hypothetical protein